MTTQAPLAPTTVKIAVGQLTSTIDVEQNFANIDQLAKHASEQECKFLFLPENFAYLGIPGVNSGYKAEFLDGPLFTRYQELAKKYKIWISYGGYHEKCDKEEGKIYNTHVVVNAEGSITNVYRKLHLFDVDLPGFSIKESERVRPGETIVVTNAENPLQVPIGLSVCYDLRFPELYLYQSMKKGAKALLVPSAFTKQTGEAHWHLLLRTRAIENQCFVIAAAQTGRHNEKRESYGHSLVVDPWGTVLCDVPREQTNTIGVAELDISKIESVRQNIPVFKHRRNNVYKLEAIQDSEEQQ